jgi:lysophospholipase L1-like esterase
MRRAAIERAQEGLFMASTSPGLSLRSLAAPLSLRRLVLVFSLVLLSTMASVALSSHAHAQRFVGPKPYFLALGNSLAFGYQPDLNWDEGYNDEFFSNLKAHGSQHQINMGCPGETSSTFINGGCPFAPLKKYIYFTPQLQAAVSFINSHAGQVSPVTLDIGANDLLPDINNSNCTVSSTWASDLAKVKTNLNTILSQLQNALHGTGDLLLMNYYDPYQNQCPNSVSYVQQLNSTIASAAASYGASVANVFAAFGGATVPDPNTCNYTWICNFLFHDIHATTQGYLVIANTFESTYGY